MSDHETVTFRRVQFDALELRLKNIADRIGPANNQLSLHQVLTHLEHTLYEGVRLISKGGNGDNSQVLEAINNLDRKVDKFMASQEERLQVIAGRIDEVLADLATLKANNPQIEDEIAAIESKLSIGAVPAEEPSPEG